MPRKLIRPAIWTILLGATYLLLAGKIEIWELVAAIASGLVAMVSVVAVTSASKPSLRINIRWLAQLRPLPGRMVRDCAVVIAALGPRLVHPLKRGVFQATKFDVTRQTQSHAPNMFVIGIDNEGKRLLFHQLVRKPNPSLSP